MTRLSQTVLVVTEETTAADIVHDTAGVHLIRFGSTLYLALDNAPQEVLDKLAVVTAAAAAEARSRTLKAVAA